MKRSSAWLLAAAVVVTTPSCRRSKGPPSPPPSGGGGRAVSFPVEVVPVTQRSLDYVVTAVGSVEAFERVQVTARIAGIVERVRFTEGERAPSGRVLVEIEPQRYRLAVDSARAALEKAKAAQAEARAGLERREQAVTGAPGLIPGEEIEGWRTRLRTAAADVAEKQAALAHAELNLRDAYVRAPFPGVIETRSVATGQYVQPGTELATLVRREPLLLRFSVPAAEAASLRPGMTANFSTRGDAQPGQARITHVAQAADAASRMVQVTAEIPSDRNAALRPGAFAEVSIPVGAPRPAPVLPQTAVRPTERGFVAFVVEDGVARERVLTLGMRTSDGQIEIKSGLEAGALAVVRGAEALRDGAAVTVQRKAPGPPSGTGDLHP